jgi:hypothetical protein
MWLGCEADSSLPSVSKPEDEQEPSMFSYMPSWHGQGQRQLETEKCNLMEYIPL